MAIRTKTISIAKTVSREEGLKTKFMYVFSNLNINIRGGIYSKFLDEIIDTFVVEMDKRYNCFWDISDFTIEELKPDCFLRIDTHAILHADVLCDFEKLSNIKIRIYGSQEDRRIFLDFMN